MNPTEMKVFHLNVVGYKVHNLDHEVEGTLSFI